MPQRKCKASVWLKDEVQAYLVCETPSEVAGIVEAAVEDGKAFVELTSGNFSSWNGKPVFLRADGILSISPPMAQEGDE